MESSSSGSSKRAKAPGQIAQTVSCLVDGCNSDLSQCREYHRRHKVCEQHSKTAKVKIRGQEQRFCQQCSRFHSLGEFDEGKRSCRKRLDGHNRRRRKPQSDSLSRTTGLFLPGHQGTRLLSFGTSQILQNAAASSVWAGAAKTENDVVQFNGHPPLNYIDPESSFPVSSMHSYKGVSQFQFSRGTDHILPEASVCQQLLHPNSASGNDSGNSLKMFSGGLNRVSNSDRALSLLSSAPSQSCIVGSSHVVQPEPVTLAPSSIHNLHFSGLTQCPFTREMESKPVVSDLDSIGRNYTTLHFQGMFQNEPEGSSASGDHKTLTFGWE
ncbi:hypothetical protein RJ639_034405 [Escallonia herrerae]|uniref:SBP-type domain-containing protein n=1 Tax=Escallonia herrerae TaxID=1293975 RepID=A0AA88WZN7_9ASTE|nr:hypothetical protein RJ639_034405 [Escallonia herrerae]